MACQEEILKNVRDNLERRLPEPEDVVEGLVHKLTSGENSAGMETVSVTFNRRQNCQDTLILQSRFQARCANGPLPRTPGTMLCCSVFYEPCRQRYNID